MNITKKDIVFDAIFLISIAVCVIFLLVDFNVGSVPDCEPTTEPTVEETTEEVTDPTETETPTEATVEPTEATEPTEPPYSEEELEYLALVIYQEAGADYCSDETRLMVGTVVMNRVASEYFPDTIYDVLTQKAQYGRFYWTGLVWPARASEPNEAHAVARAYECAEQILMGYRSFSDDVIWQAEFVQGTEVAAYQDGIYFCR